MNRTKEMCAPRDARTLGNTEEAWWYINPGSIDIISVNRHEPTSQVRLHRKQLERALEIMDSASPTQDKQPQGSVNTGGLGGAFSTTLVTLFEANDSTPSTSTVVA